MILYPRLDLHGELIQLDDLYKERHNNNVNDSLARLHALENVTMKNQKSKGYIIVLVLYLVRCTGTIGDLFNNWSLLCILTKDPVGTD